MNAARVKQVRLDLLNQLPIVLRNANLVGRHAELLRGLETMDEHLFRSRVDELMHENATAIRKEHMRLMKNYTSMFETLSLLKPALTTPAHASNSQARKRPRHFMEFGAFCAQLGLTREAEERVLLVLQNVDEGSTREMMLRVKNIIGATKLAEFARSLDPGVQTILRYPECSQDEASAEILLGLHS